MLKMIETKARNANKGRTLTADEYENIKTVLPDLKIGLRPPKVKP